MASLKEVNQKLREVIRETLGMPANSVRPANQNAPAGAMDEQFATVLISSINTTGWDGHKTKNESQNSNNVIESVVGQRHVIASVQFFRGDAFFKANRLRTLLSLPSTSARLCSAGFGFIRSSAARNITAVVDTYWEERAQLEVEFYLIATESEIVPTYGHFPTTVNTDYLTT